MSDTATSKPSGGCGCGGHSHTAAGHSCCRGVRSLRRLHAVLGLALTAFLLFHLGLAALALSPGHFENVVEQMRAIAAKAPVLPVALIGLLLVQAVIGLRLLLRALGGAKNSSCRNESSWRLRVQRWSGAVVLGFLLVHVLMVQFRSTGASIGDMRRAMFGSSPLLVAFYGLSLAGIAYHAGHGLWTGSSTWGWREHHPGLWRVAAISTGLVLAAFGGMALWAFST